MTDFPRFIDFEKEVIFRQRKPQSKTTEVINWLSDILILANSSVKVNTHKIDFTTMPDNKYTTTEVDTGKKWIDGKSIYQKSITFNTTGSGAEETGANNENFSYIDTLISIDAILNMPNGERYPNSYTNPSAPSLQYFQLKFANWNNAQRLRYQTRSVGTVAMTILYTKK